MEREEIVAIAYKHALLNAAKFDGEARVKAVIGKVMAEVAGDAQDIIAIVRQIVDEVNRLSVTEQHKRIVAEGFTPREKKIDERAQRLSAHRTC